jgi:shikimate dehydrogenase
MKKFGLIGFPLGHSFSKKYFEDKFVKLGRNDCSYDLFPMQTLSGFKEWIYAQQELSGLNVTIPHKIEIIKHLNLLDNSASAVGAVNTIKITYNNSTPFLCGYNTDVFGFRQSIKPFLASHHHKALIFGSGGSSKAVQFVLEEIGVECYFVSRNSENENHFHYHEINEHLLRSFHLLINCTPLGMSPNISASPLTKYDGIGPAHLVYDLVYNPMETEFLRNCKLKGAQTVNGLTMLHQQADKAWSIWKE